MRSPASLRSAEGVECVMPKIKIKTHKGAKKRFKVSANGKVSHKRCGSSHLNSHKSGKRIRRLRKKSFLKVNAEASRFRRAMQDHERESPEPKHTGEAADGAPATEGAAPKS
jgi:large subunit ribosomal protein L35